MDREQYTAILDSCGLERTKCKCCGGDIIYDNTTAKKYGSRAVIKGKSYKNIKKVNGKEYHLMVCQDCLMNEFPSIKNISRTFNVMSEPTKFAFDIPDDVFFKFRKKYAMTKENMIKKYGEEEGLRKWKEYCRKQSETNTFEYKHQKYGMTRAEFDAYNKSRSSTLKNFIKRHGEDEGRRMWEEYCNRQSYTKSKEYMLSQYGEEEMNRILNDRRKGWDIPETRNYSKMSQEFFRDVDSIINEKYHTYFKTKNYEFDIKHNYDVYFLDYYIEELKICIEFNGDYWHANPKIYKPEDNIYQTNMNAQQIWDKDKNRYDTLAKEYNIKTYVVWESEFRNGLTAKDFLKNIPELKSLINE